MIDDDAGTGEEYGEEGEERCPVCGRTNHPGAADTCEHFVGLLWDASIIWSNDFPRFEEAWSAVSSFLDELEAEQIRELVERAGHTGFNPRLVETANPYEFDASGALQELVSFSEGTSVTTDGMLSGSGWSLYHADPAVIQDLTAEYERLLSIVEAVLDPEHPLRGAGMDTVDTPSGGDDLIEIASADDEEFTARKR